MLGIPKSSDSRTTSANDLQLRFDFTLQPSANAFPLKPDVYSHKIAGLSAFPDGHVVDIVAMPHFLHMEGPSPVMVAAKMLTGTSETVWVSCAPLATLVNSSCFWLCEFFLRVSQRFGTNSAKVVLLLWVRQLCCHADKDARGIPSWRARQGVGGCKCRLQRCASSYVRDDEPAGNSVS